MRFLANIQIYSDFWQFTNEYSNIFGCPKIYEWISEYIRIGEMARIRIRIIFERHFFRIFEYSNICAHHWQGWANIEKLAQTNIWIYSKKCNMLERIFEYSMIFISNIWIFVYWSFTCQNMTPDTWHRKPDMCHTGMWTLSQNFRSLALMVWEFKDSNQKDDRLNQSSSNGSVCKTALATPNKDLLFSQRVLC